MRTVLSAAFLVTACGRPPAPRAISNERFTNPGLWVSLEPARWRLRGSAELADGGLETRSCCTHEGLAEIPDAGALGPGRWAIGFHHDNTDCTSLSHAIVLANGILVAYVSLDGGRGGAVATATFELADPRSQIGVYVRTEGGFSCCGKTTIRSIVVDHDERSRTTAQPARIGSR